MKFVCNWVATFLGAITFYTIISIPSSWQLKFEGIARCASYVGLFLGVILAVVDGILNFWGFPILTRSAFLVGLWVFLTGGLHLDGVMDTADGLAVWNNPQKRLEVMRDSVTGAFGVMAGCFVIILKIVALSDLPVDRGFILMAATGWGRWGQLVAIACYPYLRPQGKGAFHKEHSQPLVDVIIASGFYVVFSSIVILYDVNLAGLLLKMLECGILMGLLTGYWLNRQLGGHTGDTYGAVVEWTEALFLCVLTTN
jgi:adenosylcobinamide-GDP ribazoletransferase